MEIDFIAEVSSNHSKDLSRTLAFIDASAEIGCSTVKFQLFRVDELFAPEVLSRSKVLQSRREWELPLSMLDPIASRCNERGIRFMCTPFFLNAVDELESFVDAYKIASYELLWDDLLRAVARTGKPIVLSTGMATVGEIQHAVEILKGEGCSMPTLLHCTSSYPTPYKDANLSAMQTIRNATGCRVGWSDHTVKASVINRAIHKWNATTIEFHLDLDGEGDEFAAGHCWLPKQIGSVITETREALEADGDGVKEPVPSELSEVNWRADPIDGLRPFRAEREKFDPQERGL